MAWAAAISQMCTGQEGASAKPLRWAAMAGGCGNIPDVRRAGVRQRKTALLGHQAHVQSRAPKAPAFARKAAHLMRLQETRINQDGGVIIDRFGRRSAGQWCAIADDGALRVEVGDK